MPQHDRIIGLIDRLIDSGKKNQFNLLFHKYHEADIAEALSTMKIERQQQFFTKISVGDGVDIFEELDVDTQIQIMQQYKSQRQVDVIETMDKDDAVDLLEALLDEDQAMANNIIQQLDREDQIQFKQLMSFKDGSAGALMTPDYVSIPEKLTVKKAIDLYKSKKPADNDAAFYLFIVDDAQKIQGVISLRKLLLSSPNAYVKNIRNDHPITVHVHTDQEAVAQLFQKYRSIVLPVVNDQKVVLGVITIDDVVDVVVEEANEDLLKLSGTAGSEIEVDKLISGSIWYSIWHRLPWLVVSIFAGLVASVVMIYFSDKFTPFNVSLSFLLSFVPLLIGLGGNIGNQSSTILVRALALQEFSISKKLTAVTRELVIGLCLGVVMAVCVGVSIMILFNQSIMALSVGIAIVLNMLFASIIGAALPIAFQTLKIDPAVASAPFISSVLDIVGQVIYFLIALAVLSIAI